VLEAAPDERTEAVVLVHDKSRLQDQDALLAVVGSFAWAVAVDMPSFGKGDKSAGLDYTVAD
jgi:hypothetical protein